MKISRINEMNEHFFTKEEIEHLVSESLKIGFKPLKFLVKDKDFDSSKVKGEINFEHIRSGNIISVEKWNLKNLGLDIFKDNISDIFFTILYKDIDDKDYAQNYTP